MRPVNRKQGAVVELSVGEGGLNPCRTAKLLGGLLILAELPQRDA